MPICRIIFATVMLLSAAINAPAGARATDVRFVLDFLLQGQQSAFVLGRERGYYAAQKVNLVAFDPGRGGADSIIKVAGTHDIGFGDLSALIEFNARNAGKELLAVLLVYDQAPLSLISLKKAGIEKPADLMGRKGGAPTVDATYRLFNVFARVNGSIRGACSGRRATSNPRAHAHSRRDRFRGGLSHDCRAFAAGARRQRGTSMS